MAIKLIYITNNEAVARIAQDSGVDWIFIDLEVRGKAERQGHLNTVQSGHSVEDVRKLRPTLYRSELLVRVNPPYDGTKKEVGQVIAAGADIVMLPYFKTKQEVEDFIACVNGRAKTCLLLETPEAVDNIDSILNVPCIDSIHIGLNDLHLAHGMHFMFELLADGTVEKLCQKIGARNIPYGFGGMARIGELDPPAEAILAEHYRLGSSMVILSRSFCNAAEIKDQGLIREIFDTGVKKIRACEAGLQEEDISFFENNQKYVRERIIAIASTLREQLMLSNERTKI